ncbi:hypothetical protein niasHT_000701 [Heterodera trifolii]|uniref:B30.2/SPRY domain-containing protein n=1 Tax=Heterodera trifolii TaxID=157864 RepID=A0ABD2MF06_9BILA
MVLFSPMRLLCLRRICRQKSDFAGEIIPSNTCTYAYGWSGTCWVDRPIKRNGETFADGDTVGCGVNLANQQLIFTKNGHRLDGTNSLLLSSSVPADSLFPFVSLADYGDKISTNFGTNFMFDLATL